MCIFIICFPFPWLLFQWTLHMGKSDREESMLPHFLPYSQRWQSLWIVSRLSRGNKSVVLLVTDSFYILLVLIIEHLLHSFALGPFYSFQHQLVCSSFIEVLRTWWSDLVEEPAIKLWFFPLNSKQYAAYKLKFVSFYEL